MNRDPKFGINVIVFYPFQVSSDVWALAVVLWEMLTCLKPWKGLVTGFVELRDAVGHKGCTLPLPPRASEFPHGYIRALQGGMQSKVRGS